LILTFYYFQIKMSAAGEKGYCWVTRAGNV